MKRFTLCGKAVLVVMAVCIWAGSMGRGGLLWAANQENEYFCPEPGMLFPEHQHPWFPDPDSGYYGSPCPPSGVRPYPWGPGRPGYSHPAYPPFLPYVPFPIFLPHDKPQMSWPGNEPLIPAGNLLLLVEPPQAEVFVDGYPLQPNPDLSYEIGLLQGEHQVEVTAEGYAPFQRMLTIEGGRMLRLNIRLDLAGEP